MTVIRRPVWCAAAVAAAMALGPTTGSFAQGGMRPDPRAGANAIVPLRTAPIERLTVNPGFRDWGPATLTETTLLAGNATNKGGLFAVDLASGRLKWSARPVGTRSGAPFVATAPAVSGHAVIAPMGNTLVAVSAVTGKELWRGPNTELGAAAAAGGGLAFVLGEDGFFRALDAATGRERWKLQFAQFKACRSRPVVRDGVVYVSRGVRLAEATPNGPARHMRYLVALDAATGQERWRHVHAPTRSSTGACLGQPIVTADTLFGFDDEESTLYAINLANGRDRWAPLVVQRAVEGRQRPVAVGGLVDAGPVVIGVSRTLLIAFDKATGRTAWEIPGQYSDTAPSTAVAGRVLYFQGHPGAAPAAEVQDRIVYVGGKPVTPAPVLPGGRLNALDLETRALLWSFSRPTAEPNWSFGHVTAVDGGLWVDTYQALIKLQ
ncbi:MAG: PQQ-binding-like beta-propeller repeat protein [Pseudomonadota bacterium]